MPALAGGGSEGVGIKMMLIRAVVLVVFLIVVGLTPLVVRVLKGVVFEHDLPRLMRVEGIILSVLWACLVLAIAGLVAELVYL